MGGNIVKNETFQNNLSILNKVVKFLSKIVDSVSSWEGMIGGIVMSATMFLTVVDVAGGVLGKWTLINAHTSYFRPIIGGYEITSLMMLIVVSLGIGYCAQKKGHVRVDVIMQFVSKKVNLYMDIFANIVSAFFYFMIMWQGLMYAINNIISNNVTSILFIPMAPFNIILAIGALILFLIFIRDFLNAVEEMIRP
jgi:TRAP-type C4-dicarboxylate transport system permease small subunit